MALISLLALLLSSEPHREALMNVLKEALVPKEISARQVENIVGSVFTSQISFGEEELGPEGKKNLHIVCKCKGYVLSRVMIDNGSALNLCPLLTLQQMKIDQSQIRTSKTAVRAFDGTKRDVYGEIDLPLEVGPCTFSVTFKVMEIPSVFSLLLGRPWLHAAGAVPSSLHQKLKFIIDNRLITIEGEGDYNVYKETAVPFISTSEDELLPYHSFELLSVIKDWGEPTPDKAEIMLSTNFIPGLGARNQGIPYPLGGEREQGYFWSGISPILQRTPECPKQAAVVEAEAPGDPSSCRSLARHR
jgi:hypothetical protein